VSRAPEDHYVVVKGKRVYFTFGYRFGPLVTNGFGDPLPRQPISERHPFWTPFSAWLKRYMKTNPPPPIGAP
jgi:hypothetical protein